VIADLAIETAPVTAEQARLARDAYRAFGKGHHPARPNYGDCLAYALS
jgi:ribonuclease VapC